MKEIAIIVLQQMLTMSVCMAFGYFCYKVRAISDTTIREFASLTMKYTIPLSITLSFKEQFRFDRIMDWGLVFFYSVLGFVLIILMMTAIAPKGTPNYQQKRLCGLIPNNAIFGIAIAQSLFGYDGVFLMSSQIVVSNILLWTYGIGILSERPRIKNVLFNPAVLGVLAGVLFVMLPFQIPEAIYEPLEKLTALNSPIGLMLAGCYIARINLLQCFKSLSYYILAILKLIVGPLLLVPILLVLKTDRIIALTVLIGLIAPTGTAAATFAEMVGQDNTYSSGSVAFNELVCIITIPLMLTLFMTIF